MYVWNVLHAARWKCRTQKNPHLGTIAQLCRAICSQLKHISTTGHKLLTSNTSSTCPHNMANFGPITTENCWRGSGTPANFNGFRVLAALVHGTPGVGVSQTLRRWTEGATYIPQGDHHVGHWPTFLVRCFLPRKTFILTKWWYNKLQIITSAAFGSILLSWPPVSLQDNSKNCD